MLRTNRLGIAALAALFALGLSGIGGIGAVPAGAATPNGHVVAGGGLVLNSSINCEIHLNGPAVRNNVVSVTGTVTCDHPVTSLNLEVELFRDNQSWGDPGFGTGTISATATASGPCVAGTYYGTLYLQTQWPAPVVGPPTFRQTSGPVDIDC